MPGEKQLTERQLRQEVQQLRQMIATLKSLRTAERKSAMEDRRAADRILELCEHDRRLIGYEIHDGFLQKAMAALMRFQAFQKDLPQSAEKGWATFRAAVELLQQGIADARRLVNARRNTAMEESNLRTAIEKLISETQRYAGPPVALHWQLHVAELSPPLTRAVYRIVQECLTNVARHSQSNKAHVRISEHEKQLQVEVKDWGIGFDVQKLQKDCVGLEGIRLRARLAGGKATIDSAPGRGTTVLVELPLV